MAGGAPDRPGSGDPGAHKAATHPGAALSAARFDGLMASLGRLGSDPTIAVAVSGGADSLALALLLHDWAGRHGGRIVALTVDHGLRPEARHEARQVAAWLRARGLAHHTLTWRPVRKPESNLQAAAREARYSLLQDWCARHGVLFLAVAHHREDQAETVLLRQERGSGLDGLAAMPAVAERGAVALLRPLLTVPKAALLASLRARGQDWVEDPSNRDPRFDRVRLRESLPALAARGLTGAKLAADARRHGRARAALEAQLSERLAGSVALDPAGFARVDGHALLSGPDELSLRALGRLIQCIGGAAYRPRLERLERLHESLRHDLAAGVVKGRTLGGCRLLAQRAGRPGTLSVVREAGRIAPEPLVGRREILWDRRFEIRFGSMFLSKSNTLVAFGQVETRPRALRDLVAGSRLPAAARNALPALVDGRGVVAVPHLRYWRDPALKKILGKWRFAPKNTLSPAGFTVA